MEEKCNALQSELDRLAGIEAESMKKDEEIISLRLNITELEEKRSEPATDDEKAKAEYYDSICSKAGEILFIASGTAEDILNRANDEANKIVGDANSKKDLMLKTFSDSVDEAACDINTYIRRAVDDCIVKINKSVNDVTRMAKGDEAKAPAAPTASPSPAAPVATGDKKRPRTVFINVNKKA